MKPPDDTREFLDTLQIFAMRYLAAGDQHYSKEGLSLHDMFKMFATGEEIIVDFCSWTKKTIEEELPR